MRPAPMLSPPGDAMLSLVRDFGSDTVSFQALEEGVRLFRAPEGGVAYVDTGRCWVSAGAPLAPEESRSGVARAFLRAAKQEGRRVCFCAVERGFDPEGRFDQVQIGSQPVWDPRRWPEILFGARSLREQLRRARAKHVQVRLLQPHELRPGSLLRASIERVAKAWLLTRSAAPLHFLLDVQLFLHAAERRLFVAQLEDKLVGVLNAIPIYGRRGWFFEDILRDPSAPNGTAELLIDAGMKQASEEGSSHVTMGLVPLAGRVPFSLRAVRKLGAAFYDFDGLRRFREKLKPHGWEPIFLRYPESQTAIAALWDVLRAVTGTCPFAWAFAGARA